MTRASPEPIHALTGIRGCAALWVALFHFQAYRPDGALGAPGLRELVGDGWLAVDLFFVLSGFIMMHVHGHEFVRPTLVLARRFLALRWIRIYPVHFVVLALHLPLLLLAVGFGLGFNAGSVSLRSFLLSLLLLNGWGLPGSEGWNVPSWSVSSEWFAYLAFPGIAALVARVGRRREALALGAALLALVWALGGLVSDGQRFMLPAWGSLVRVTSEFCLGCLAYRFRTRAPGARTAEISAELGLAAIVAISLSPLSPFWNGLSIAAFVVLIVGLSRARGPLAAVLGTRPLLHLGRISYSIYMIHSLVLALYARGLRLLPAAAGGLTELAIVIGYALAVVACAHVLYTAVEAPARRRLRRSIPA